MDDQGISRAQLLTRAGAGLATAGALGPAAAASLAHEARGAKGSSLTPRRAAREIRRVITGKRLFSSSEQDADVWDVHRLLADPKDGPVAIRLLDRQKRPQGIDPQGEAIPRTSIPQDRISAEKFWWGYSVYFPHDPLVNTVVGLIENQQLARLTSLLSAALTTIDMGWVVTALKAYVIAEIVALVELDKDNDDGGAQLNATWPYPEIFVPTEM